MKKCTFFAVMVVCSFVFAVSAYAAPSNTGKYYDLNGEDQGIAEVECYLQNTNLVIDAERNDSIIVPENILSVAKADENFVMFDIRTKNGEEPDIESEKTVTVGHPLFGGSGSSRFGKEYRLFVMEEGCGELVDITSEIIESDYFQVKFKIETAGTYVLLFNPEVCRVTFYMDLPRYVDGIFTYSHVYTAYENLKRPDAVVFPEFPHREGYVFTGWKVDSGNGIYYQCPEQPVTAARHEAYYATWCPEDEYEPIRLSLLSDGDIEPGKEDGEVLTLRTNYGIFENEEELNSLASECWKVVGAEGVTVSGVKRTGDKEVKITLSGNSADVSSGLYVEFDCQKLLPEPYEKDGNIVTDDDTKIKMDEYGFRARMYRSDNALVYGELSTGDVDGSGSVNTRDAVALRRAVAGGYDGNPVIGKMLDVNGDGRVNTRDIAALRTIIVQ